MHSLFTYEQIFFSLSQKYPLKHSVHFDSIDEYVLQFYSGSVLDGEDKTEDEDEEEERTGIGGFTYIEHFLMIKLSRYPGTHAQH